MTSPLPPKKVLFMVRRPFFDAIERGVKTSEFRSIGQWGWIEKAPQPTVAVFMSGPRRLKRQIVHIQRIYASDAPPGAQEIYPDDSLLLEIMLGEVIQ